MKNSACFGAQIMIMCVLVCATAAMRYRSSIE